MPAALLREIAAVARIAPLTGVAGALGVLLRPLSRRQRRVAVVVPPASAGSRGDEALVCVVERALREGTGLHVEVAEWSMQGSSPIIESIVGLAPRGWWALVRRRPARLVIVGADVFDGYYDDLHSARRWDLARFASRLGVRVDIVSVSWSGVDDHRPLTKRAIRRLPGAVHVHPRDAHSAARLHADGIDALPPTADLAFVLRPDAQAHEAQQVAAWIAARRARGRRCVGVGLGAQLLGSVADHHHRADALAASIVRLAHHGVSCVLIPHDHRATADDTEWCAAVYRRVDALIADAETRADAALIAAPPSAGAAKAIVGQLDLLVSHRMHLSIAALSQEIPTVTFDYQGKVSGLAELLGGGVGVFRGSVDEWCASLPELVAEAIRTAPERVETLRRVLPSVTRLVERALAEICRP